MRNKGVKPEDDDVPMSEKLDMIESVPISLRTPDQRMDHVDDIVTWLQNGNIDSDDPTRQFKKIDQMLPKSKRGQRRKIEHVRLKALFSLSILVVVIGRTVPQRV